jgi:hypothetical protein
MPENSFTPGPTPNTVCASDGRIVTVPDSWVLVPPGDAALSRRIKAAGDHYAIAEKKGRKVFSRGIRTAAATIERIRADLETEGSIEGSAKRKKPTLQWCGVLMHALGWLKKKPPHPNQVGAH